MDRKNLQRITIDFPNVPVYIYMGSTQNYSDQNKGSIQINTCLHVCCDVG